MTAVHFFYMAIYMTQIFLLFPEERLTILDNNADDHNAQRQNTQCDQSHNRADGKHHAQYADHHGNIGHDLRKALVECLGDGIDIVGDTAKHFAVRNTVKVSKRHPVDLFADVLSHRIAQLGCHTGHNPSLYIRKQRTDYIQASKENQNLSDCMKVDASGSRSALQSNLQTVWLLPDPKSLDPKMEKMVLAAAQTSTRIMLGRNFFR